MLRITWCVKHVMYAPDLHIHPTIPQKQTKVMKKEKKRQYLRSACSDKKQNFETK